MSETKVIWSGTYAGVPAEVRIVNGKPVPFLAGRRSMYQDDFEGILGAAVMSLAVELASVRASAESALDLAEKLNGERKERNAIMSQAVDVADEAGQLLAECAAENEAMRERLAKLEELPGNFDKLAAEFEASAEVCDLKDAHETASNHYGVARGVRLAARTFRECMKGPGNVEAETK